MSNAYHVLYEKPALTREQMPSGLEMLAEQLVNSGRLRIHTDTARNFITYSGPGYEHTFSKREFSDVRLAARTREILAQTVPGGEGAQGVEDIFARLHDQFRRTGTIDYEKELQVARLLVQATHPAVILLSLYEGVDYFVSYSHNVADLMAMHFWEQMEGSGGLQSVSGDGSAVYVSCGGNPFIEDEAHKTYTTDGFPALARGMVIAAQECGHYADIMRDAGGRPIGRHSARLSPFAARDEVARARRDDLECVQRWQQAIQPLGIGALAEQEKQLRWIQQYRKYSAAAGWLWVRMRRRKQRLLRHAGDYEVALLTQFPDRLEGSAEWAGNAVECLRDMAFNLAPDADAYRRDDPREEEAIICVEALARVPQQAMKWGHAITRMCWPNLYAIYYDQVVPNCISAYEAVSGKRFYMPDITVKRRSRLQKLRSRLRKPKG